MSKSAAIAEEIAQRLTDLEDLANDLTVALKLYEQAEEVNKDKILAKLRVRLNNAYSRRNYLVELMLLNSNTAFKRVRIERLRVVNSILYNINRALYANAAQ